MLARLPLVLALAALASGCVMPNGEEVIVSRRAGRAYTGNAVLLEISEDHARCRVAVRNNALFIERRWVDCRHVHSRPML